MTIMGSRVSLVIVLTSVLVTACATLGPTPTADWPQRATQAMPPEDGTIKFSSAGSWLPDTAAYSFLDTPTTHAGVLVLAERSAAFLQWNAQESRYHIVWRLLYSQITDYRIESYGRSRRLVVASKDYRTQSFELTGPGVGFIDREKTEEAFQILKSLAPLPPQ